MFLVYQESKLLFIPEVNNAQANLTGKSVWSEIRSLPS